MYEEEIQFLRVVEDPHDITNQRQRLNEQAIERLRRSFPSISEEYLAYLREIGAGNVRKCQYEIYEPDFDDATPLFLVGTYCSLDMISLATALPSMRTATFA